MSTSPCSKELLALGAQLCIVGRNRVGKASGRIPGGPGHLELIFWHPASKRGTTIRVPLHPKQAYEQGLSTARLNAARIIARELEEVARADCA